MSGSVSQTQSPTGVTYLGAWNKERGTHIHRHNDRDPHKDTYGRGQGATEADRIGYLYRKGSMRITIFL